jgi:hypothetical protein
MPMSDGTNKPQIAGICQEVIDRLDDADAALHPRMEDLGSSDPELIDYWRNYAFSVVDGKIRLSTTMDSEILKCILNDMAEDAGVRLLLHSLFVNTLVEDDAVKGVVFESKSGRQAVLGKVFIDSTGDGDVFASAGALFDGKMNVEDRASMLALTFRIGKIDIKRYHGFRKNNPQAYIGLLKELESLRGFTMLIRAFHEDMIWVNNNIPNLSGSCLSGCFSRLQYIVAQILRPYYGLIICGATATSKPKKSLKGGHRLFSPIVPKDEFIQVNLEVMAADTMVCAKEPLL